MASHNHVPPPGDQMPNSDEYYSANNNLYGGFGSYDQNSDSWTYPQLPPNGFAASQNPQAPHDFASDWSHDGQGFLGGDGMPMQHQFHPQQFDPQPYSHFSQQTPAAYNQDAFINPANVPHLQHQPQDQVAFQSSTITPGALQTRPTSSATDNDRLQVKARVESPAPVAQKFFPPLPNGTLNGKFLVTAAEQMQEDTKARQIKSFLFIGDRPVDLLITKGALPTYHPRKSRNEIRRLLKADSSLSTSVAKKLSKRSKPAGPRPPKSSAVRQRRASESASDVSSDDSEYSSSDEEEEKSPLPATRPTTAVGNTEYDTIKALWRPKARTLNATEIRTGLSNFWDIVKNIRDGWKSDSTAVKDAEEKKKTSDLPLLKERVASQRTRLGVALKAAIKHGHPDIIELFGENLAMMHTFALFLSDRAKELDYNGSLSRAMLDLLAMCTNMTTSVLQESKISKVLERYTKRGDQQTKSLVKRILDNGAAAARKKKESKTAPPSAAPVTKTVQADAAQKAIASLVGVKRPRPVEGESPSKKPNTAVAAVAAAAAAAPTTKSIVPPKTATTDKPSAPPKVNQVTSKPNEYFSLTGIKRSATSTPSGASAAKKPAVQSTVTVKKPAAPAPKTGFSFAEAFASVSSKPKEPERVVSKSDTTPPPTETEAEKTKRLRKEARRKLRVTFKPEGSLVEVRVFEHHPDEEEGHDANQVRDVLDAGSEGRMFKAKAQQALEDDDMDEEYEPPDESSFTRPYPDLTAVDFSVIDEEERKGLYEPYGGGMSKPETPEKEVQILRESNTLMAVYASSEDIPLTPKEPAEDAAKNDETDIKIFGAVPELIKKRLDEFDRSSQQPPLSLSQPQTQTQGLLAALTQSQPQQQSGNTELDKLLASFNAVRPSQQPSWPIPSSQPAPNDLLSAFLGQQTANQGWSQQIPIPTPPLPQQQQPQSQPQQSGTPQLDLTAILASLGVQNAPQPSAAQPNMTQVGAQPAAPQWPTQAQPQGQNTGADGNQPYENEERRRMREEAREDDGNNFPTPQIPTGPGGRPWNPNPPKGRNKEGKSVPMYVVPCKYWKEGRCKKGKECTFLHEGPGSSSNTPLNY